MITSEATLAAALRSAQPRHRVRPGVLAAVWPGDDASPAVDPGSPDAVAVDAADVRLLFGLQGG